MSDDIATNVKAFALQHGIKKKADDKLKDLKDFFKEQAGSKDAIFSDGKHDVIVTSKEKSGWDMDAIKAKLGKAIDKFRTATPYVEVSCRKAKKAGE